MVATQHLLQIVFIFIITPDDKNKASSTIGMYEPRWRWERYRYPPFYPARNTAGCGNVTSFHDTSGTITSPGYPSSYPEGIDCNYIIEVANGKAVNITFNNLLTEDYHDWVQIRCSNGTNTYLSSQFSGRTKPPLMSFRSCRQIKVQFHSDYSASYSGFSLNYSVGETGLSGGIISAPKNVYIFGGTPQRLVLSCGSSISMNGTYPWWTYIDYSGASIPVTNSMCEPYPGFRGARPESTNKFSGPNGSVCNITFGRYYFMPPFATFTCTDSSLSTASAMVARLDYSIATDRDNSGKEIVKGDNITITCRHPLPPAILTGYQLNVSTYFSSVEQDFIPKAAASTSFASTLIVEASGEVLPSYACHINFSLSESPSSVGSSLATNLPDDFTLRTEHHEVLFWPESETMTVIGALNGKMEQDGVLTCHVPANPEPKYRWLDVASGNSSAGPTVHVLHSGDYTCFATNFIRHRIYNASKSVTIEIIGAVAVKREAASTVGVVFGVIILIAIGMYTAGLFLLYRKIASLNGYVSQSVNMGRVSCHLPATNEYSWENTAYDDHDKIGLVSQ